MANATPFPSAYAGFFRPSPVPSVLSSQVCSVVVSGYDYRNNTMIEFNVAGTDQEKLDQCCSACSSSVGCSGFVLSSGTCSVKSAMENRVPSRGVISGYYGKTNLRRACAV
ncbi:hypothetical protein THRCLA_22236 [Thraustotheca clavata]|uniref:Apple domain-containing protein n=1 Tax=Thraustotheca clavata TaxID=74557 RepID=A0A1V9Z9A6_9STRA|nr:hypothetical protein THRCLA_22236 [Thraustotheca clavata]